jgi:hypothetical protein
MWKNTVLSNKNTTYGIDKLKTHRWGVVSVERLERSTNGLKSPYLSHWVTLSEGDITSYIHALHRY